MRTNGVGKPAARRAPCKRHEKQEPGAADSETGGGCHGGRKSRVARKPGAGSGTRHRQREKQPVRPGAGETEQRPSRRQHDDGKEAAIHQPAGEPVVQCDVERIGMEPVVGIRLPVAVDLHHPVRKMRVVMRIARFRAESDPPDLRRGLDESLGGGLPDPQSRSRAAGCPRSRGARSAAFEVIDEAAEYGNVLRPALGRRLGVDQGQDRDRRRQQRADGDEDLLRSIEARRQ